MEYRTDISVEEALGRAQAYFARDWPFGGVYTRIGNELICRIEVRRGCLANFVDLLIWTKAPEFQVTKLLAYSGGAGGETILSVRATVPEHAAALEQWLRDELNASEAPT